MEKKIGSIIESLLGSLQKIREHNKLVAARETKLASRFKFYRAWGSVLLSTALASTIIYSSCHPRAVRQRKLNEAIANVEVGNYETAERLFDETKKEQGVGALEVLLSKTTMTAQINTYFQRHCSWQDNLTVRLVAGSDFSTPIQPVVVPPYSSPLLVVGHVDGLFSVFNNYGSSSTYLMRFSGLISAGTAAVLATTDHGIYRIELSYAQEENSPKITLTPLFSSNEKISEVRRYAYNGNTAYFFMTEQGNVRGISETGEPLYSSDNKPPKILLPPVVIDQVRGPSVVLSYSDNKFVLSSELSEPTMKALQELTISVHPSAVGDFDGNGKREAVLFSDRGTYLLDGERGLVQLPGNDYTLQNKLHISVADANHDGIDDLLIGREDSSDTGLYVFPGDEYLPLRYRFRLTSDEPGAPASVLWIGAQTVIAYPDHEWTNHARFMDARGNPLFSFAADTPDYHSLFEAQFEGRLYLGVALSSSVGFIPHCFIEPNIPPHLSLAENNGRNAK
ncbi:MAG: VCBS repeat-containing protein [Candidatus Woesearchaeota archaeon]|nr:VCBS repeat-containing protein [Candidatus Woesearchaeota archaeon]